jgi:hypothetical protein
MSAAVARAERMRKDRKAESRSAAELADLFCRIIRRRVEASFRAIRNNDDVRAYRVARRILDGEHLWLENGLTPIAQLERLAASAPEEKRAATV